MIKSIGMVLLLPIWIVFTLLSPIACYLYWVDVDKQLGVYKSFWDTWWRGVKENWIDDPF